MRRWCTGSWSISCDKGQMKLAVTTQAVRTEWAWWDGDGISWPGKSICKGPVGHWQRSLLMERFRRIEVTNELYGSPKCWKTRRFSHIAFSHIHVLGTGSSLLASATSHHKHTAYCVWYMLVPFSPDLCFTSEVTGLREWNISEIVKREKAALNQDSNDGPGYFHQVSCSVLYLYIIVIDHKISTLKDI